MTQEPTTELIRASTGASMNLFGADNPRDIVIKATEVANVLAKAVSDKKLFVNIGGKKHVEVEGWTLLGSLMGVFAVPVWSRALEDKEGNVIGFEARVEARTRGGELVGAAEAEVRFDEPNWKGKPAYAVRSMAQTRAAGKALRLPLGFIMQLAGFNATPREEMTGDYEAPRAAERPPTASPPPTRPTPAPRQAAAPPPTQAPAAPPPAEAPVVLNTLVAEIRGLMRQGTSEGSMTRDDLGTILTDAGVTAAQLQENPRQWVESLSQTQAATIHKLLVSIVTPEAALAG